MTLVEYITNLDLQRHESLAELELIINDKYSIVIEHSSINHIFFIDKTAFRHNEIYRHIQSLDELKIIYLEKTGKDIEILNRKNKLKYLESC